jgi:glycosyltransferase involved in cell wall biosynthesis
MLLLGNPAGDSRVLKTVRTLQDAGYAVTVYYIGPTQPATPPDLHGGTIHYVWAPRPLRRIGRLRAMLRRSPSPGAPAAPSSPDSPPDRQWPAGREAATTANRRINLAIPAARHSWLRDLRALGGTLWLNLALAMAAARQDVDIIHANDLDTLPAAMVLQLRRAALTRARSLRLPGKRHPEAPASRTSEKRPAVVYDSHELYPDMHAASSALYAGLWRLIEHLLIVHAAAVITVNESLARELQRRHRLARRPAVVMNCAPRRGRSREPLPSPDGPLRLLFHGGLNPERGLEELIAALPLVDSSITLSLRGDGPLRPKLEDCARLAGVADRVHFLPHVPPDQIMAELEGYPVGVVPYLPVSLSFYYSSPVKVFEYMMGGLAVLASDFPEIRYIIETTGAGLLYDTTSPRSFAAAVDALARDPDRLARCRQAAGRAADELYHWERQAAVLLEVYAGLRPARA